MLAVNACYNKNLQYRIKNKFHACCLQIYKGYVDDPRNTDNAWMETKAINFHDEDGTSVGAFSLNAGMCFSSVQGFF